jgi:O-methyltransferase
MQQVLKKPGWIAPFMLPNYFDLSSPAKARESLRKACLFYRVRRHTLTRSSRLNVLYTLARDLDRRKVPGAVVECGVYRGGSAAVMAQASEGARDLHLFDSFQGLPPPGERDGRLAREQFHEGWCAGDVAEVRKLFERLHFPASRLYIHAGWFHDTLPRAGLQQVALLHIDADWYDSVMLCLRTLYDSVTPGGYVVLDDYGRWEGCTRATNDFLKERGLEERVSVRNPPFHFFEKP